MSLDDGLEQSINEQVIIALKSISKRYEMGGESFYALDHLDLSIFNNDYLAIIMGEITHELKFRM